MSMHDRCPETGEYEDISLDFCEEMECGKTNCKYYPDKVKIKNERLEKFRSSEFGKDVTKRASTIFALTEIQAEDHIISMVDCLQQEANSVVRDIAMQSVQARVAKTEKDLIDTLLEKAFEEAVENKVLAFQKDQTTMVTNIQKHITDRIEAWLREKTSKNYNSSGNNPIEQAVTNIVNQKVDEAITELKQETIDKFSKEAMKKMMEGMARAIGDDKKLLSMMTD